MTPADEQCLELRGFLCFARPAEGKTAAAALSRLDQLGVVVKIVTGDNGRVAERSAPTSA